MYLYYKKGNCTYEAIKNVVQQAVTVGMMLSLVTVAAHMNAGHGKQDRYNCKKVIRADEIFADKIKVKNLEVCSEKQKIVHVKCPKPACDNLPVQHLFTMTLSLITPVTIPNGPNGTRLLVGMNEGVFEGANIKGIVAAKPGGDWLTIRPDGTGFLDARILLQTEAGDYAYMTYQGIANFATGDIRSAPLFQADSSGPLAYLNNIQAVGIGKLLDGGVAISFEIFALL